MWGYYNMFNLARMPDTAFQGMFRLVFTFVLPITLVSNVPAKTLISKLTNPAQALFLVAITAGWFFISEAFWRYSLRRYTSASS